MAPGESGGIGGAQTAGHMEGRVGNRRVKGHVRQDGDRCGFRGRFDDRGLLGRVHLRGDGIVGIGLRRLGDPPHQQCPQHDEQHRDGHPGRTHQQTHHIGAAPTDRTAQA